MLRESASFEFMANIIAFKVGKDPLLGVVVSVQTTSLHSTLIETALVQISIVELWAAKPMQQPILKLTKIKLLVSIYWCSQAIGSIVFPGAFEPGAIFVIKDAISFMLSIHIVSFIVLKEKILGLNVDLHKCRVILHYFFGYL